jgi:hypothetical protein
MGVNTSREIEKVLTGANDACAGQDTVVSYLRKDGVRTDLDVQVTSLTLAAYREALSVIK